MQCVAVTSYSIYKISLGLFSFVREYVLSGFKHLCVKHIILPFNFLLSQSVPESLLV